MIAAPAPHATPPTAGSDPRADEPARPPAGQTDAETAPGADAETTPATEAAAAPGHAGTATPPHTGTATARHTDTDTHTHTGPGRPADDEAARLRAVIGRLSRRLRPTAAAVAAGLTPTRVSVLLHAVREGEARLAAVAEAEGINPTMLSRIVADLVDAGLLERVSDEHDRRAAWVRATAAGRRLAEQMRRERTEAVTGALARLSDAERAQVLGALPALEALADTLMERRA